MTYATSPYLFFANAVIAAAVGLGVGFSARRSAPRIAFAVAMLTLSFEAAVEGLRLLNPDLAAQAALETWRFVALVSIPAPWVLFSFGYARGRPPAWIDRLGWRVYPLMLLPGIGVVLAHSWLYAATPKAAGVPALGPTGLTAHLYFLLGTLVILTNLEHTYRGAVGTMRWRIKYMTIGLGVYFAVRAFTSSQALLFQTMEAVWIGIGAVAFPIAVLLLGRSLMRSGHFDIAVYPSPAVLRSSITIVLAGIYLLVVGLLAKVASLLGGDSAFAVKAFIVFLGLVTLAIILQSDRVRLWVRRAASRHFQRPMFDYRAIWRTFAENSGRARTAEELGDRVVRLGADIFHALSVNLWVAGEEAGTFRLVASSNRAEGSAPPATTLPRADAGAAIAHFRQDPSPLDLDDTSKPWAAALARCNPGEFKHGGHRVCAPLVAGGDVVGLLVLGDRVSGEAFAEQDRDLLRCIADHLAATLENLRLSQRLLETRQFEAFQAMATFFVHDLKNSASTLNLMLQNLPVHFDDPAFRQDALRGMGKTVAHINQLIGRLNTLRQGLSLNEVETRLGDLVRRTVAACGQRAGVAVTVETADLPALRLDPEQFGKVLTNLVLNAFEAMPATGTVRVATSSDSGYQIVEVTDTGCGMTPEFRERMLFRPFQTTKKTGLGIGMFQSKMIVEAHRGRVEVSSQPGQGTTFRIFLPETAVTPPAA